MDDLLLAVQVLEREGRLVQDALDLVLVDPHLRGLVQLQQVLLHVLEDHLHVALVADHLPQLDDVGVLERRQDPQLAHGQLLHVLAALHLLDGHGFARAQVFGLVDVAEVAAACSLQDLVLLHLNSVIN